MRSACNYGAPRACALRGGRSNRLNRESHRVVRERFEFFFEAANGQERDVNK